MKNLRPFPIAVLISLGLFLFSFAPRVFSDEAAQESAGEASEDFSAVAQNNFPDLANSSTAAPSTEADTHAPSGQAANPEPTAEDINWKEYQSRLKELNAKYDNGDLTARQYNRR